ncbi:hypothetical protein [Gordonia alkaliphila]|uniref:Uncharacterized protein n=1 Tax=Gordonia alkaliphila TaxID=1053547 RepID=A0ABP8ZJG4_9ACTN
MTTATCAICSVALTRRWRNYRGVLVCTGHSDMPTCTFCFAPAPHHEHNFRYCTRCRGEAVDDNTARSIAAEVMTRLSEVGVTFAVRPTFRISDGTDRPTAFEGQGVLGWTSSRSIKGRPTSIEVVLRRGLTTEECAETFAHEVGHAYARSYGLRHSLLEEGFCEAIAYFYLLQYVPGSEAQRQRIIKRADDYGDAFRTAATTIRSDGITTLLSQLRDDPATRCPATADRCSRVKRSGTDADFTTEYASGGNP